MKKNSVHNCGHNTPLYSKAKINFSICRVQKRKMEKAKKSSTSVCFKQNKKKKIVKQFGEFTTNSSSNMKLQKRNRVAL